MIPKIIHQTWKTEKVPDDVVEYVSSWRKFHPTWEYRLWTDDDNRELVRSDYEWLLPTYDACPYAIQRADIARLLYMHKYGGLYVDLDFECFRSFDGLICQDGAFLGREKGGLGWHQRRLDYACNALLASSKGHLFWVRMLEKINKTTRSKRFLEPRISYVLETTGPQAMEFVIQEYLAINNDLIIYPENYFYPAPVREKSCDKRRKFAVENNSYAVHHYSGSWISPVMHMLHVTRVLCTSPIANIIQGKT